MIDPAPDWGRVGNTGHITGSRQSPMANSRDAICSKA